MSVALRAATLTPLAAATLALACGSPKVKPSGGGDPMDGGMGGDAAMARDGGGDGFHLADAAGPVACDPCDDFPAAPIVQGSGVPANAAELFGAGDAGRATAPCLAEPEAGTLYPRNWLRPRVRFTAASGHDLFEVRITTARQRHPLVVYSADATWTMPKAIWEGLARNAVDQDIVVRVRSLRRADPGSLSMSSTATIRIAPVEASGSIVYWTTTGGSALKGFRVGEESVVDVLRPAQNGTGTRCVGCHASTPDGDFAAFSASPRQDNGDPAFIGLRSANGDGNEPAFLTPAARALLARPYQQLPKFSPAHWRTGDRIALTMMRHMGRSEIVWTDLEATSESENVGWGVIARTGDTRTAGHVSFSRDGTRLVYCSADGISAGTNQDGGGDIYSVPYNDRRGGAATPIAGASDPSFNEFYPSLSSDDRWVAFTRVPNNQGSYNNANAEIAVVPVGGGAATLLAANQPPACTGAKSPGVTNSWPKWSPTVGTSAGKTYYWLTFSSTRSAGGRPQLYVTPLVVSGSEVQTFPALYLWNQPENENNHTPAWDQFKTKRIE